MPGEVGVVVPALDQVVDVEAVVLADGDQRLRRDERGDLAGGQLAGRVSSSRDAVGGQEQVRRGSGRASAADGRGRASSTASGCRPNSSLQHREVAAVRVAQVEPDDCRAVGQVVADPSTGKPSATRRPSLYTRVRAWHRGGLCADTRACRCRRRVPAGEGGSVGCPGLQAAARGLRCRRVPTWSPHDRRNPRPVSGSSHPRSSSLPPPSRRPAPQARPGLAEVCHGPPSREPRTTAAPTNGPPEIGRRWTVSRAVQALTQGQVTDRRGDRQPRPRSCPRAPASPARGRDSRGYPRDPA